MEWRNKEPFWSTVYAAAILSTIWATFWLIVFFLSTWILGYETGQTAFILAFWLSVGAEAVIRWAENTDYIAKYSKPNDLYPKGDNQDFRLPKALLCLLSLLVMMFVYLFLARNIPDLFGIDIQPFGGQPEKSVAGFIKMLSNWKNGLLTPGVTLSLLAGFIFRIVIYKRNHN